MKKACNPDRNRRLCFCDRGRIRTCDRLDEIGMLYQDENKKIPGKKGI